MKILISVLYLLILIPFVGKAQANVDTLKIGYYESPPFVYKALDGSLTGISIWIWDAINEDAVIPYKMEYVPLSQILDELADGTIDICLNPLTVTGERLSRVDFTYPFFVSNSAAVVQEISSLKKAQIVLASFFSANFFKAVFALFLIILIFGFLVWIFERKKNVDQFPPSVHGIMSGVWWSAVTMTTVGYGDKSPQTFWGRTIALIWMFTAVIILSGFTAGIASSLTVNHLNWSKNSIMDFRKLPVGVIEGSATEDWMRKRFFTKVKTFQAIPEGLDAVKSNKIKAFVHDEPILKYYQNKSEHADEIEFLPTKFNLQFYSFGLAKNLDEKRRETITRSLLKITEGDNWQALLSEYDLIVE